MRSHRQSERVCTRLMVCRATRRLASQVDIAKLSGHVMLTKFQSEMRDGLGFIPEYPPRAAVGPRQVDPALRLSDQLRDNFQTRKSLDLS